MNPDLIGVALGAGLLAAVNPCGFALLPGYLALVVAGTRDTDGGRAGSLLRAAVATLAMTAGFLTVFGGFGVLTVAAASAVQRVLPIATVVLGIVLIAAGGWLLTGRHLHLPAPATGIGRPTARLGSMFGYGVAYAVASVGCTVAPFLAVTAAATRTGSLGGIVAVYLAYAAGFAVIVGTVAIGTVFAGAALTGRLRALLPAVGRIGGALLVVTGLYVAYYGGYELRLFHFDVAPDDVVVAAAARVQGVIAGWVHQAGALPWVVALVLLGAAAIGWAGCRRR